MHYRAVLIQRLRTLNRLDQIIFGRQPGYGQNSANIFCRSAAASAVGK
jgi:hypothetical protein